MAEVAFDGTALMVPGPGEAVVGFWWTSVQVPPVRLRAGESLEVGRNRGGEPLHSVHAGAHRVVLPTENTYLSRAQLRVSVERGDWRVTLPPGLSSPGKARRWGSFEWERLVADASVDAERGLLAILLPCRPQRVVMTVSCRAPRGPAGGSSWAQTEPEPRSAPLRLPPSEADSAIDLFADALHWPPPELGGRPIHFRERIRPEGAEARRKAYERLVDRAALATDFEWTPQEGATGPDSRLLRELIDSGTVTYQQAYRRLDRRLIPTHHTHDADGRVRA